MKNFALIGAAGYIVPRYMKAKVYSLNEKGNYIGSTPFTEEDVLESAVIR